MECGPTVPVGPALAGASRLGPVLCGHLSGRQQATLQRTPTLTTQVSRGGDGPTCNSLSSSFLLFLGWADPGLKPVDGGQSFQNTNPFGTSPSTTTLGQVFSGQFVCLHACTLEIVIIIAIWFTDNNNDLFAAAPKPFISDKPGEWEEIIFHLQILTVISHSRLVYRKPLEQWSGVSVLLHTQYDACSQSE